MSTGDIIQLLMLIASTAAIIVSAVMSRETIKKSMEMVRMQNHLQMFAEYTKRYESIIMNMPETIYKDKDTSSDEAIRYMQLYFNLCSEEYDLWNKQAITEDVWQKWFTGMQMAMKEKCYLSAWKQLRESYAYNNRPFVEFMDSKVVSPSDAKT